MTSSIGLISAVVGITLVPTLVLLGATWWVERNAEVAMGPRIVLVLASIVAVGAVSALLVRRDRQLRSLASRDSMTGLYNHLYFREALEKAMSFSTRKEQPLTVLMLDIDRFKEINDTYGHQAGDEILRQVAARMQGAVREYDVVARYGGEEFGFVLPESDESGAIAVAERVRREIARDKFEIRGGLNINCSVSIGYAVYPEDAATGDELIERADRALYTCKYYGRNQLRRSTATDLSEVGVQEHRELLEALATLVDLRDGHSGKHAREVARWSRKLAIEMGFDPYQVNLIEAAALVHDIGKVGVPDGILLKPEGLDEPEWEVIRKHPEWGATVVGRVASLRAVADLVEQHQEWYDGRGYPKGLAEAEIEIGARVIAVVDTFHAIVNDRPYRQAQPVATALSELERMAGTQFDPALVDNFVGLIRRGEIEIQPMKRTERESDRGRRASDEQAA